MNVQREDSIVSRVGGSQVDAILPDDRGGAAFPRQSEFPGHALDRPGGRVVPGRSAVVTSWPAPIGPVGGKDL